MGIGGGLKHLLRLLATMSPVAADWGRFRIILALAVQTLWPISDRHHRRTTDHPCLKDPRSPVDPPAHTFVLQQVQLDARLWEKQSKVPIATATIDLVSCKNTLLECGKLHGRRCGGYTCMSMMSALKVHTLFD